LGGLLAATRRPRERAREIALSLKACNALGGKKTSPAKPGWRDAATPLRNAEGEAIGSAPRWRLAALIGV